MDKRGHRVLIVAEGFNRYGGIETYCRNLGQTLADCGVEVHYLATNYQGDGFAQLPDGLPRHDLSEIRLSLKKPFTAARLINRLQPDLLLSNHCSLMHYALPLLSPKIRPIVVLHSDQVDFYARAARGHSRIFRWIAPSPKLAERFAQYVPPSDRARIRMIPHGIDPSVFSARESVARDPLQIVFAGSVLPHKGVDLFPAIMEPVWRSCPDAHLVIAGEGASVPLLKEQFERLGGSDRVWFVGRRSQEELADLFRQSAIFLFPTQVEGFGLVIAEAMMCGAVPVVSMLSGITDAIVKNGCTGFLVDRRDPAKFATTIVGQLEDRLMLTNICATAAVAAKTKFSSEAMSVAYRSVFDESDDRNLRWPRPAGFLRWAFVTVRDVMQERRQRRNGAAEVPESQVGGQSPIVDPRSIT